MFELNTNIPGMEGITPRRIQLTTTDSLATITTAGYLNQQQQGPNQVLPTDVLDVLYDFDTSTNDGTYQEFVPSFGANDQITLVEFVSPGDVTLPVIDNHIAVFDGTTGKIKDDAATAINGGNIQAGLSGTAGYLASFSSTAARGSLRVTAVANTGDTVTTISNAAMGQASTVSIPDPGAATASFILTRTNSIIGQTITGALTATGGLSAGTSGTAASVASYPATAARGSLRLTAVNNTGDTLTTISNAAMGQASTISIPDPGAATANFLLSATAAGTQSIGTGLSITGANNIQTTGGGNILAGSSGASGAFYSYPSTAAKGTLAIVAADNVGDTDTIITNASMGQASTITIPDPTGATGTFGVFAALPATTGDLVRANGTGGLIAGAGFNIKSATTAVYGGGGTSNAFAATGLTASSIVTAVILSSTNAVSIVKAVPGSNTLTVDFSADPGANTTVSWIATSAAVA